MAVDQKRLELAGRLVQLGNLPAARSTLAEVLHDHPTSVEALALLGRVAAVQDDMAASRDAFTKAVALAPERADLQFDFGNMLAMAEDFSGAIEALSVARAMAPANPDYAYNLGCAYSSIDRHPDAIDCFRAVTDLRPKEARGWESLGHSALAIQDWDTVVTAHRHLLDLVPDSEDATVRLMIGLRATGQHAEADALKHQVITRDPGGSLARQLVDMGSGQWVGQMGEQDLVAAHLADPLAPDPLCDLAEYYEKRSRLPELLPQLIAAAMENGDHARIMTLTGQALIEARDVSDQTEAILLHADALGGQTHKPCNALGYLYEKRGNLREAVKWYRKAHEHDPTIAYFHSNLLFALRHANLLTPEALFAEHCRYGQIQETAHNPLPLPPLTPADADRKLRIGFVSPDFREHAVTMFFEPYLDHLDRSRFHVTLYYTLRPLDKVTERLRGKADRWRHIANLNADDAARLVQADGIDILIDLAGHTAGNGLPIFVHKPAHLQVTWIGYPGTTGMSRMDYRIGAPADQPWCTERILSWTFAFRPPQDAPDVAPQPVLSGAPFTFACLNRTAKASPAAFEAWAEILRRTPGSRLIIMAPRGEAETARQYVMPVFQAHGVTEDRVDVRGALPLLDFLAMMSEVDLALDTFPYTGGTTALLTLWMGVPYVTLMGQDDATRSGGMLLNLVGLGDMVAQTPDEYIDIAVKLAKMPEYLSTVRAEARAKLSETPLLNEGYAATMFQDSLTTIWQDHVAQVCSSENASHPADMTKEEPGAAG